MKRQIRNGFCCVLLMLNFQLQGQNSSEKVSLHFQNTSLLEILEYISDTYGLEFSYSKNHLSINQPIDVNISNVSIQEALYDMFEKRGIRYQRVGNQIALKQGEVYFVSTKLGAQTNDISPPPPIENVDLINRRNSDLSLIGTLIPVKQKKIKTVHSQNLKAIPKSYGRKTFQTSIVPGIGTNGIDPGAYKNNFSINIISGNSAATYGIEIGGFSNFNTLEAKGLQLAGLANVVGGNALIRLSDKEIKKIRKEGYQFNMDGIQIAGIANVVRGNMTGFQATIGENLVYNSQIGFQISGVGNVVREYSTGVQLAGFGNMAGRSVTGFQLAGLTNFSMQRVDGVQVSGFFNYTKGRLNGTQLALVNFSGNVEGKFSKMSTKYSGLQIGAFNKTTRNMDGFQIGLVNWVGDMNGLQVGLINISNKNQKYPIGLINVNNDEYGYVRAYASELFLYNFELATGSKHIINTISYHLNPSKLVAKGEPKSAVGYAIGKTILRKFIFYNGDLQFQHVNYDKGFTKDLSLLTKLRGTVGIDPFYGTKLRDIFIFGGVTLNSYVSKQQTQLSNEKLRLSYKENGNKSWETWIGFMVGINVDIH